MRTAVVDGPLPDFHPALKAALTFPLAWGTSPVRDFRVWRRAARAKVDELQIVDREDGTPYAPEFGEPVPRDGYRAQSVTLSLTRYARVRAALLTPDGPGPFPAVLLHDHGAKFDIGKEKLVRPWDDDVRLASARGWAEKYFSGRFVGDEPARRGYVVLCADALGWGDRGPLAYDQQQALASNFFHLGSSLAGLMAREDARAAGFLAGLDRVDARRVAAVGFSMGAYRAWQTAALTDAVRALAPVCWMTGLMERIRRRHGQNSAVPSSTACKAGASVARPRPLNPLRRERRGFLAHAALPLDERSSLTRSTPAGTEPARCPERERRCTAPTLALVRCAPNVTRRDAPYPR
ncbi:dienelactone hydrolase family protein [Streptomyces sp. NPDC005820]|uniref:dienelactone hydrolase family protein n=1 Tax=Streptomyces sp. NPDC005820 TaxID=3157069 RepID=UPI0033C2AF29